MANVPSSRGYSDVFLLEQDFSDRISPETSLTVASFIESKYGESNFIHTASSASDLENLFGIPDDDNALIWLLNERPFHYKVQGLGATLQVVRVIGDGSTNGALSVKATGLPATTSTTAIINNRNEIDTFLPTYDETAILKFHTRYPTDVSFKISVIINSEDGFTSILENIMTEVGDIGIVIQDASDNVLNYYVVSLDPLAVDGYNKSKYIMNVLNEFDPNIIVFHNTTVGSVISASLVSEEITVGSYIAPVKADYITALELFEDIDSVDIKYILAPELIVDECITLAENRQDCSVRAGVPVTEVIGYNSATALSNIVTYTSTTLNRNTTYMGALGANAIYVDDKYNIKKRWLNIAGDLIGLRIQQNLRSNPWFSEAGPNYGQLKDVIALAQNWTPTQQIALKKAKCNPIINKRNIGKIVTEQINYTSKISALRDENVRELINHIWRASKLFLYYKLHEFNDEFTRANVESQLRRFLVNVQDGRGIRRKPDGSDGFYVRCDETNNTEDVISQNLLIADIGLLPNRVISEIFLRVSIFDNSVQMELYEK